MKPKVAINRAKSDFFSDIHKISSGQFTLAGWLSLLVSLACCGYVLIANLDGTGRPAINASFTFIFSFLGLYLLLHGLVGIRFYHQEQTSDIKSRQTTRNGLHSAPLDELIAREKASKPNSECVDVQSDSILSSDNIEAVNESSTVRSPEAGPLVVDASLSSDPTPLRSRKPNTRGIQIVQGAIKNLEIKITEVREGKDIRRLSFRIGNQTVEVLNPAIDMANEDVVAVAGRKNKKTGIIQGIAVENWTTGEFHPPRNVTLAKNLGFCGLNLGISLLMFRRAYLDSSTFWWGLGSVSLLISLLMIAGLVKMYRAANALNALPHKVRPKHTRQAQKIPLLERNVLQRVGSVAWGLFAIGWLLTDLIAYEPSDYAKAEQLTAESVQAMNDMADFGASIDLSKPLSPQTKQKMDELTKRLEDSANQLTALKLSFSDRAKLRQKYNAELMKAKRRMEMSQRQFLNAAISEWKPGRQQIIRSVLKQEDPGMSPSEIDQLIEDMETMARASKIIREKKRRGETVPNFTPRQQKLLEQAENLDNRLP